MNGKQLGKFSSAESHKQKYMQVLRGYFFQSHCMLTGLTLSGSVYCIANAGQTRSPAKARGGRPYETGSRNMAATQKSTF